MNSILVKNVSLDNKICDVLVEGTRFKKIGENLNAPGAEIISGANRAMVSPFFNTHTHSAMTLLRGYADDLELFDWLSNYIWPLEAKLTEEDIYHGTRLAILEMIQNGTVFFNDMYWHQMGTVAAAKEMGMRAAIGMMYLESEATDELNQRNNRKLEAIRSENSPDMLQITLAPHAIYTVGEKKLRMIADKAKLEDFRIHIHVAETAKEYDDCMKLHGMSPVQYLNSLNLLSDKVIMAHSVHLNDEDIRIIHDKGAYLSHMPVSNCKLVSGTFRYAAAVEQGKCRCTIGTDGVASNNNLSMLEEMKAAALSAKIEGKSPKIAKDKDVFKMATQNGAEAFGIDSGVIEEGKLADFILIDLKRSSMVPNHNLIANLVYSADSSCITHTVCNGRILMENGVVPKQNEIIENAIKCTEDILKRR